MNDDGNRIFHNHELWEEIQHNMWGHVDNRNELLEWAIGFTGDAELYGKYMNQVVDTWKYSCEHHLSCKGHNRKAWLGHAACALANRCPEDIVREAWGRLTDEQRDAANDQAAKAIARWESTHMMERDQSGLFDV